MILIVNKIINITLFSLLLLTNNAFAAKSELLHANEWSVPKKATTLLAMPAINKVMKKLLKNVNSSLAIKYPGGDEGTLWANELRSWLVALGLSSKRIELIPGSAVSTIIELDVLPH